MTTTNTIQTTVNELENAWGSSRDEWGLIGPAEMSDDETIRFTQISEDDGRYTGQAGQWVIERFDEEGGEGWYVASDARFSAADVDALNA